MAGLKVRIQACLHGSGRGQRLRRRGSHCPSTRVSRREGGGGRSSRARRLMHRLTRQAVRVSGRLLPQLSRLRLPHPPQLPLPLRPPCQCAHRRRLLLCPHRRHQLLASQPRLPLCPPRPLVRHRRCACHLPLLGLPPRPAYHCRPLPAHLPRPSAHPHHLPSQQVVQWGLLAATGLSHPGHAP